MKCGSEAGEIKLSPSQPPRRCTTTSRPRSGPAAKARWPRPGMGSNPAAAPAAAPPSSTLRLDISMAGSPAALKARSHPRQGGDAGDALVGIRPPPLAERLIARPAETADHPID